jgi:hypothetical protein
MMSVMNIMIYMMLVMNIMIYIYDIPVILDILNVKNKKINCNGHFAVRLPKPPAKTVLLPCVYSGARQRGHLLPCVLLPAHGKDLTFAVRFAPRCTAKGVTRRFFIPVPSVIFFLPCVVKKRMAKIIYRLLSDTAKGLYRAKYYRVPFTVRPTKNAQ